MGSGKRVEGWCLPAGPGVVEGEFLAMVGREVGGVAERWGGDGDAGVSRGVVVREDNVEFEGEVPEMEMEME